MTSDASIEAREVDCRACLDPDRWKRHRQDLGCAAYRARCRQAADWYLRLGMTQREIAARRRELGIPGASVTTVCFDLAELDVPTRPQTAGLKDYRPTPEHLLSALEGRLAQVERVKAERGLIDVDEVLERARRAGVPQHSRSAIVGYARAGLLKRERGLPFAKPWLFTEASAEELIAELLRGDGRMRRYDDVKWRNRWIGARHGRRARLRAQGRTNARLSALKGTRMGAPRGVRLPADVVARIRDMASRGKSQRTIALALGISRGKVRRVLGL